MWYFPSAWQELLKVCSGHCELNEKIKIISLQLYKKCGKCTITSSVPSVGASNVFSIFSCFILNVLNVINARWIEGRDYCILIWDMIRENAEPIWCTQWMQRFFYGTFATLFREVEEKRSWAFQLLYNVHGNLEEGTLSHVYITYLLVERKYDI